jgi:hypothetical protein
MTKDRARKQGIRAQAAATGRTYQATWRDTAAGESSVGKDDAGGADEPSDEWDGFDGGWPVRHDRVEQLAGAHDLSTATGVAAALDELCGDLDAVDGWDYTEWSVCAKTPTAYFVYDQYGVPLLDGQDGNTVQAAHDRYEGLVELLRGDMEFSGMRD